MSKSTVSRAFTQPYRLTAETVERIIKIAEEFGYVPNHTARALSTGRHGNLALLVSDVANPFFPPLIRAAQMEADTADFCVFLGNSDEDARQEDKLIDRFISQVEGLLLVSSRLNAERIQVHARRRPLALINLDVPGVPRVLIDSTTGVRDAMNHLADLGHKRIAYVSGPQNSWANRQRRNAVRLAARKYDMTVEIISPAIPSYDTGRAVVPQLIDSKVTAAVAFDDLTAQGIMTGMAERGIEIPRQFSLVGCDDVLGPPPIPRSPRSRIAPTKRGGLASGCCWTSWMAEWPAIHAWCSTPIWSCATPPRPHFEAMQQPVAGIGEVTSACANFAKPSVRRMT